MQECAGVLVGREFHHAAFISVKNIQIQKIFCPAALLLSAQLRRTIHRSVILLSLSKYQDFQAFIRDLYIDYVFHLC